jgi:hypothetical protein
MDIRNEYRVLIREYERKGSVAINTKLNSVA